MEEAILNPPKKERSEKQKAAVAKARAAKLAKAKAPKQPKQPKQEYETQYQPPTDEPDHYQGNQADLPSDDERIQVEQPVPVPQKKQGKLRAPKRQVMQEPQEQYYQPQYQPQYQPYPQYQPVPMPYPVMQQQPQYDYQSVISAKDARIAELEAAESNRRQMYDEHIKQKIVGIRL